GICAHARASTRPTNRSTRWYAPSPMRRRRRSASSRDPWKRNSKAPARLRPRIRRVDASRSERVDRSAVAGRNAAVVQRSVAQHDTEEASLRRELDQDRRVVELSLRLFRALAADPVEELGLIEVDRKAFEERRCA